ncbi:SPFH domain-containing protein [Micromonospora sp. R77]|uniref:SPFH domain-containing protein n=1 Tax=Micromonospora sp. R77 TaxID=2925836 RepID=UPI001F61B1F4|nr:SPFH domain-containing protein [Micromonospora sp. R77]MCI4065675.1 SPFH domain-containing protein [Micromonospora sp. R77]
MATPRTRPSVGFAPRRILPATGAVLVGAIVLIVALTAVIGGFDKTAGGEVGVVRNGGWLDNNRVRQVIPPASSLTWTGMYSTIHRYPAQQRFYTLTSDPKRGDRTGIDVVNTPSSDGVEMGIEGTIYFTLNLDPKVLKAFDTKFGTRQFRGVDGQLRYAYDGDEGWSTFLDAIVRPVIDNDLRIQLNSFRCAELVSSCALVQNGAQRTGASAPANPDSGGQTNNTNIAKVQEAVNSSLPKDLAEMLGGDFFEGIKFNLARVTLPQTVQDAVNKAQAAYAQVSEAQARVAQARAEAEANKTRQQGYDACSACAQIDIIKALPPGVTTYAPGAGTSVPLK